MGLADRRDQEDASTPTETAQMVRVGTAEWWPKQKARRFVGVMPQMQQMAQIGDPFSPAMSTAAGCGDRNTAALISKVSTL